MNRKSKLEISASAWPISASNRVCEAFKTAATWQEAARRAAAGAQPRVRRLCPAMAARGWHGLGARQSRAVCQLCAGAGERGTVRAGRAPQQPLLLPCQHGSWERPLLQHVNANVDDASRSFSQQTVPKGQRTHSRTGTSGEEGLGWWREAARCQLLGAVGTPTAVGLWDGTRRFSKRPEPCLGEAALRAGRSFWSRLLGG